MPSFWFNKTIIPTPSKPSSDGPWRGWVVFWGWWIWLLKLNTKFVVVPLKLCLLLSICNGNFLFCSAVINIKTELSNIETRQRIPFQTEQWVQYETSIRRREGSATEWPSGQGKAVKRGALWQIHFLQVCTLVGYYFLFCFTSEFAHKCALLK